LAAGRTYQQQKIRKFEDLPIIFRPMIDTTERLCTLALLKAPNLGPVLVRKLIAEAGSAQQLWNMSPDSLSDLRGRGAKWIPNLNKEKLLSLASKDLDYAKVHGIEVLHYQCMEYPKYLLNCYDYPLLLYKKGRLEFKGRRVISIVGTRSATQWGKRFCSELVEALMPYNPIVVSGLAFGIDIAVHKEALKRGLHTVACLAHGLDRVYPQQHSKTALEIVDQGCLLSEYGKNDQFDRPNFIARNRIIAGLSTATVVIESAFKGGSLATAELAQSYNRDVYAIPGRPSDPFSAGCNALIRDQKAQLIYRPQDLLDYLGWTSLPVSQDRKKIRNWLDLPAEQQALVGLLEKGRLSMDQLLIESGWSISKLSAMLFDLELKQLVRAIQGQQYELC